LEVLVENATEAELGLLWLGLGAFTRGEVLLGGAKSRGLGWCRWEPDWTRSRYVGQENLLDLLLADDGDQAEVDRLAGRPRTWLAAFAGAIGLGGNDA
jgi:CRISPR/Cas system CSM-associated protein Csm3 (group 7 of RAMP superfamily)